MAKIDGSESKRCPNFINKEVELLVNLVQKYSYIIECKNTDSTTWKEKEEAWEKLSLEFNSCSGGGFRSAKNLNVKYNNIKKSSKKIADEKQQFYKTGGGKSSATNITPIDTAINDLMGETSSGLEVLCNSDDLVSAERWKTWNPVMLKEPESAALRAEEITVEIEDGVTAEQEALDIINEEENKPQQDRSEIDAIYIAPPEPDILTDEDSGDEEQAGLIDNLNGRHLRANAEIKLKIDDTVPFVATKQANFQRIYNIPTVSENPLQKGSSSINPHTPRRQSPVLLPYRRSRSRTPIIRPPKTKYRPDISPSSSSGSGEKNQNSVQENNTQSRPSTHKKSKLPKIKKNGKLKYR
ncbi:hypothetical protein C0J52_18314 [Blattella germanica]|nr:hypothetical protein C0J52_18314 [Blattella germanica]